MTPRIVNVDQSQVVSVQQITLDLLDASPKNPRRTMDDKGLEELAASIKQSGIAQPLLIRPQTWVEWPVEMRYEIVCGHRRCEAGTMAGLAALPCIIREMSDQEAAEIALVDNLQRVDVPALEEAEAFGELLALHGTVEAVAARVGKDVAHVAKRLKLRSLGVWQRDALRLGLITVDHALLLARIGIEEQDKNLKWCLGTNAGSKTPVEKVIEASAKYLKDEGRYRQWEPETVVRLREQIERSVDRELSRAPWSLADDSLLGGAPACDDCPSNTKANRALFEDLDIEKATCADGACFERKREAFVQIRMSAAAKDAPPLRLSWKATTVPPRFEIADVKPIAGTAVNKVTHTVKLGQVFKDGQWVEAKKGSCPHILAGVAVDWSDAGNRGSMGSNRKLRKPGELIQACVAEKCKAHPKAWEKVKESAGRSGRSGRDEKAEKEKRELAEAERIAESKIRLEITTRALAAVTKLPAETIRLMAVDRLPHWAEGLKPYEAVLPGIRKILLTAKVDSAEFARAFALASIEDRVLTVRPGWSAKETRSGFLTAMNMIGYNASKAFAEAKPDKPSPRKALKPVAKKAAKKAAKK